MGGRASRGGVGGTLLEGVASGVLASQGVAASGVVDQKQDLGVVCLESLPVRCWQAGAGS